MKAVSVSAFAVILNASASFAGGCAKHDHTNLEAMSCQVAYTWNEELEECVQALQA